MLQNILENMTPWLLSSGIKIAVILVAARVVIAVSSKVIKRAVSRGIKQKDKEAEERRENTLVRIFTATAKVIVWVAALMMILPEFGVDVGPVLAGAGVLGVALGFGAQYMVRDFLAGLFIIMENQYRVGDVVCLDGSCGGVEDITLRKTVLRDLDGKVMHIPNGSFKAAANLTKEYSRCHMDVSVAYKEDVDKVMSLINRVGREMAEVSPWKEYILKPIQVLGPGPDRFENSAVVIKVLGETKPLKQWDTLKEFRRRLKAAFDKEGVEIPFPQMAIWQRK